MVPNASGNFSLVNGGGQFTIKSAEKNDISALPTAAIICLAISGYILLMAIALVIRRCLKTNGSSKFVPCCCPAESNCQCPKCKFGDNFPSLPACCTSRDCSCCSGHLETLKERCTALMTCGKCCSGCKMWPFCANGDPLCECGNCNCVCACQLPRCQSINCCCFEIQIRP